MFTCKVCEKEFELKSQLAGHSNLHTKTKKKLEYEANPRLCKECGGIIPYSSLRRRNKMVFCGISCRSKFFYRENPKCLLKNKKVS